MRIKRSYPRHNLGQHSAGQSMVEYLVVTFAFVLTTFSVFSLYESVIGDNTALVSDSSDPSVGTSFVDVIDRHHVSYREEVSKLSY